MYVPVCALSVPLCALALSRERVLHVEEADGLCIYSTSIAYGRPCKTDWELGTERACRLRPPLQLIYSKMFIIINLSHL
jgi:hypothetical protein